MALPISREGFFITDIKDKDYNTLKKVSIEELSKTYQQSVVMK